MHFLIAIPNVRFVLVESPLSLRLCDFCVQLFNLKYDVFAANAENYFISPSLYSSKLFTKLDIRCIYSTISGPSVMSL